MPKITSGQLKVNEPIEVAAPDATLVIVIDTTGPLKVGSYTFQLEVMDDSGNRSKPVQARLFVADVQAPTAIISAPRTVPFGSDFTLSGMESSDVGGGTISRYIWTLIQ
jgi:chitodextrinase